MSIQLTTGPAALSIPLSLIGKFRFLCNDAHISADRRDAVRRDSVRRDSVRRDSVCNRAVRRREKQAMKQKALKSAKAASLEASAGTAGNRSATEPSVGRRAAAMRSLAERSAVRRSDAEPAALTESGSALQHYLHWISRFPLLTREEEYELAVKYYEKKDPKAAEKLVQSNLRFVVKTAGDFSRFGSKIMDLIQEGNVGLIKAVQEFNPYRETRLITYAAWWIKGCIQEYLLRQHSLVRIGAGKKEKALYYLLQREKDALNQFTQTKSLPESAGRSGVSLKDIERMKQRVFAKDLSLNQPIRPGASAALLDFQEDKTQADWDEKLSDERQAAVLKEALKDMALSKPERAVLQNRLLNRRPDTLQKIADSFQVSREAIRQTERRLMQKLRKRLIPLLKKPY